MIRFPEEFERIELSGASGHWRGMIRQQQTDMEMPGERLIACCEQFVGGALSMIKDRCRIAAAVDSGFFFKLYKLPGKIDQIKRRFRCGRAVDSLNAALALKRAGIDTPEVWAVLEYHRSGHIQDLLITRALPAAASTLDHCKECDEKFLNQAVIPVIVRMHDHGIAHGDLNLRNIYRDDERIGLIDLDGATVGAAPLKKKMREKELARLSSGFCKSFPGREALPLLEGLADSYQRLSGVVLDLDRVTRRFAYFMERSGRKW